MWLTSLFLLPQLMGFYLRRPSASSSLPSAKLNSSLSPFSKGGFATAHLLWAGQTGTGSPQAGGETSAQLQKEQASLGSWQHPLAHGEGKDNHRGAGLLLPELEKHPTAGRQPQDPGPADALHAAPLHHAPLESLMPVMSRLNAQLPWPSPCPTAEAGGEGRGANPPWGAWRAVHRQGGSRLLLSNLMVVSRRDTLPCLAQDAAAGLGGAWG